MGRFCDSLEAQPLNEAIKAFWIENAPHVAVKDVVNQFGCEYNYALNLLNECGLREPIKRVRHPVLNAKTKEAIERFKAAQEVVVAPPEVTTLPLEEPEEPQPQTPTTSLTEELLKALATVGRLAQAVLDEHTQQKLEPVKPSLVDEDEDDRSHAPPPGVSPGALWNVRFGHHAYERLQERYGVPRERVVGTLAYIARQLDGLSTEARSPKSLELLRLPGTGRNEFVRLHAVECRGDVCFVLTSDDNTYIVTVLPKEPRQLKSISDDMVVQLEEYKNNIRRP